MMLLGPTVAILLLAAGAAILLRASLQVRQRRATLLVGPSLFLDRAAIDRSRFRGYMGIGLLLHGLIIGLGLIGFHGCRHERPLGVVGGSGDQVTKGQSTNLQQVLRSEQQEREQAKARKRVSRESLLQLIRKQEEVPIPRDAQLATMLDSMGLPTGVGAGTPAAGSPFGTRIGGKLYLYRLKHNGDAWDANPRALPTLLRNAKQALGVEPAGRQEIVTMADLPRHSGKYMPSLLFITGTGGVHASEPDRRNLRDYLLNGGMLVADSSGGSFEKNFENFIRQVLPDHRLRIIEFDHDVYRGGQYYVPYQLPRGCPIYRDHGNSSARGIFAKDGRLMVFLSPGDLGSAWALDNRSAVQLSFQMGTNLIAYALQTVRDMRKEGKK